MSDNAPCMNLYSNIAVPVRGQPISLTQIENKHIYWELIGSKELQASVINTWINLYLFLHAVKWHKIFNAVHHSAIKTYMQSFQYKGVHRIINCKYNLCYGILKKIPFAFFAVIFKLLNTFFISVALVNYFGKMLKICWWIYSS